MVGDVAEIGGISVRCDAGHFPGATVEIVPEYRLEDPTFKPDFVAPRYVRIRLVDEEGSKTFFPAEICVYPLEGFRDAYANEPHYFADMQKEAEVLRSIVEHPTASARRKQIPYLLFIDASETFHLPPRRVDFVGGEGIAFLTQYEIEPSLINNKGVTYLYEGFTDDGRTYVVATIPVSSPLLASSYESGSHDGYTLDPCFFCRKPPPWRAHRAYVARTVAKLAQSPPESFTPDLDRLDAMMKSLRVEPTEW